jgi:hypothetical protein
MKGGISWQDALSENMFDGMQVLWLIVLVMTMLFDRAFYTLGRRKVEIILSTYRSDICMTYDLFPLQ